MTGIFVAPIMLKVKSDYLSKIKTEIKGLNLNIGQSIPRFGLVATIGSQHQISALAKLPFVDAVYPDNQVHAPEFPLISQSEYGLFSSLPTPDSIINEALKITRNLTTTILPKKEISKGHIPTFDILKLVGADKAHSQGLYGRGIRVAVLDTCGIQTPPQQIKDYTPITAMMTKEFADLNGHGAHVAKIIAGASEVSRTTGLKCIGLAPKATVVGIKCLGGVMGMGMNSDLLKAIDIAITNKCKFINMSLGSENPKEYSVVCKVIDAAVEKYDIIPVIAAGNSGNKSKTIGDPGICKKALTIGAGSTRDLKTSSFSSRGPVSIFGMEEYIKPDAICPGGGRYASNDEPMEYIYSGTSMASLLDSVSEDNMPDGFAGLPGTSQATPIATALSILAYETGIIKTVDDIKDLLKSAYGQKNSDEGYGWYTWDTLLSSS